MKPAVVRCFLPIALSAVFWISPFFMPSPALAQDHGASPALSDISVTGDAPFTQSPDFARITVQFVQTSAGAREAIAALDSRSEKLKQSLAPLLAGAGIHLRGDRFVSAPGTTLALRSGAPVTVERSLAVDCPDITKVGTLIDTALMSGADKVVDVDFSIHGDTKPNDDAIALATARAKEKAQRVAQSLGVNLGPALSVLVTEEPEGAAIRQQLQHGPEALEYADRSLHVYATVRFAIAK
jgi:uncharacterized protein YggE